ncbi:MAG: M1 family aminopeptidase [Amphiamblys sp. WSBS2006]|nr:MAG: M1 family aminopeptidase [Amphiamblys sp. WSBS2006]
MEALQEKKTLPENIRPESYRIFLEPNIENGTFIGETVANLVVLEDADEVVLNSVDLIVERATISVDGGEKKQAMAKYIPEKQQISFSSPCKKGSKIALEIAYRGEFNKNMAGFYLSSYKTKEGTEKRIATTQFEPADARRAFPCFDEPERKAVFEISLRVDKAHTALSNMDVKSVSDGEEKKTVCFNPTPLCSTYLVAFIVGELESIETTSKEGVSIRCFTVPGKIEQARFALDVTSKCLSVFTKHFKIPYPLSKLDSVAIPDFSFGAMENWGLVTYRETALLYSERQSSTAAKQRVAAVVCHELAHQWFGNLVTMKWWSDLWLNEGFATWAGSMAVNELHPEWDVWVEFVVDDIGRGLSLDSMKSTHPVHVPVSDPDQVGEIFDAISYSKGASMIKMLAGYLGEDKFMEGICAYLEKHKYANAETEELWAELEKSSGKPVSALMAEWIHRPGYPLVHASYENKKLCLKQERFVFGQEEEAEKTLWKIPLAVETEKGVCAAVLPEGLLKTQCETLSVESDGFIKINPGQTAFFRVHYSDEMLAVLGRKCRERKISEADRVGLVSDVFALARLRKMKLVTALKFFGEFSEEQSYFVWMELSAAFAAILDAWWEQDEETVSSLELFFQKTIKKKTLALGFEYTADEDEKTHLLRTALLSFAARIDLPEVTAQFAKWFQTALETKDDGAIHPNITAAVFAHAVRTGGEKEHGHVFDYYRRDDIPADKKIAALSALGTSREKETIEKTLRLTLDTGLEAVVRGQDVIYVLASASRNKSAKRLLWAFVKENWAAYRARFFGSSTSILNSIVAVAGSFFNQQKDIEDFKAFFGGKDRSGIERKILQKTESMELTAGFLRENSEETREWLAACAGKRTRTE